MLSSAVQCCPGEGWFADAVRLQPVQSHTSTQLPRPVQGAWAPELLPSSHTGNMAILSPAPAVHSHIATSAPLPSLAGAQRAPHAPPMGLVIPHIPVRHVNGKKTPKSESWRDIVRHWTVGEPRVHLYMPLKDWPHHYYNG